MLDGFEQRDHVRHVLTNTKNHGPLLVTRQRQILETPTLDATQVAPLILRHLGAEEVTAEGQAGRCTPELAGR